MHVQQARKEMPAGVFTEASSVELIDSWAAVSAAEGSAEDGAGTQARPASSAAAAPRAAAIQEHARNAAVCVQAAACAQFTC